MSSVLSAAPHDTRALRNCLGQMATGVTVIATRSASGALVGLTANSFSALSLEPALVLWSLRLASPNLAAFAQHGRFVVNVLSQTQGPVSSHFASGTADKFDAAHSALNAHSLNDHQLPLLHGACAWFECRTVQQYTEGDHCLFIALVERFSQAAAATAPLLYHGGGYHALGTRL